MRLGVDGWRLLGARTGVARYCANVLGRWDDGAGSGVFERITLYLPRDPEPGELALPGRVRLRVLRPDARMLVWENLRLGPFAGDDVLFCPSYTRPVVTRARTVVTTHDATQKLFPELFPGSVRWFYNPLYGWSARNATLVITDSAAARDDIARAWDVPRERIRVVHLAAAEIFRPLEDRAAVRVVQRRCLGGDEPFFLFVGKLSGRRSIPLLLGGFAEFKRATALPHRLLVVGLNIHDLDVARMLSELGIGEHVAYPGFVGDGDLNALYNAADAFVSPSIYETVSLPVMEAQAAGTPVVCIDTAGMREITGGHAELLERPEPAHLAAALARLARDGERRRELSARGREHAQVFTWARCARETLAVLEEAATAEVRP
jgi:glycosyltransferase involved in cell wall biosynthesis